MGYADNKKRKRKDKGNDEGIRAVLKGAFVGLCVSLAAAVALWLVATLVAYSQSDPDSVMPLLAFLAIYIASFCGGIASSVSYRDMGVVCALLSGAMFFVVLLFVSIFAQDHYSSGYNIVTALLLRAASVGVFVVGGVAGRYKRQKKRFGKR